MTPPIKHSPERTRATPPALVVRPLPTALAAELRAGASDANGQPPERHISDGDGVPCRHCLTELPAGAAYLLLAHRPFPSPQPYAEIGPIFLCAEPCAAFDGGVGGSAAPEMFGRWPRLLIRGYGATDRIVPGTGRIVAGAGLLEEAAATLADPRIAYVHVRSASNNCFMARIERQS